MYGKTYIISWKSFNKIYKVDYHHGQVNHKYNLIDTIWNLHQNIKEMWEKKFDLKEML